MGPEFDCEWKHGMSDTAASTEDTEAQAIEKLEQVVSRLRQARSNLCQATDSVAVDNKKTLADWHASTGFLRAGVPLTDDLFAEAKAPERRRFAGAGRRMPTIIPALAWKMLPTR